MDFVPVKNEEYDYPIDSPIFDFASGFEAIPSIYMPEPESPPFYSFGGLGNSSLSSSPTDTMAVDGNSYPPAPQLSNQHRQNRFFPSRSQWNQEQSFRNQHIQSHRPYHMINSRDGNLKAKQDLAFANHIEPNTLSYENANNALLSTETTSQSHLSLLNGGHPVSPTSQYHGLSTGLASSSISHGISSIPLSLSGSSSTSGATAAPSSSSLSLSTLSQNLSQSNIPQLLNKVDSRTIAESNSDNTSLDTSLNSDSISNDKNNSQFNESATSYIGGTNISSSSTANMNNSSSSSSIGNASSSFGSGSVMSSSSSNMTSSSSDGQVSILIETHPPVEVRTRTPSEKRNFSCSLHVTGDYKSLGAKFVSVELLYSPSAYRGPGDDEMPKQTILGGTKIVMIKANGSAIFDNLSLSEASTKHKEKEFCLRFALVDRNGQKLPISALTTSFYAFSNTKVLARRRDIALRTLSKSTGNFQGGETMHVVGNPFIRGPALKLIFRTPHGDVMASNLELYSETVLFFTLPAYPTPHGENEPPEVKVQVLVTNDGRNFSNPLDFIYVSTRRSTMRSYL